MTCAVLYSNCTKGISTVGKEMKCDMIILDYTDRRPIYEQVVERFQSLVLCGVLEKDAPLPSVRSLAMELSINPNTIQRAYTELERRGVIYAVKGKGNFVADIQALLTLREKEVKEEARLLVRRAKEAGMSKEVLGQLLDEAWQGEKVEVQNNAPEHRIGGEAHD